MRFCLPVVSLDSRGHEAAAQLGQPTEVAPFVVVPGENLRRVAFAAVDRASGRMQRAIDRVKRKGK